MLDTLFECPCIATKENKTMQRFRAHAKLKQISENVSLITNRAYFQEPNSEKTNNGIHYKLQLLYSNGKSNFSILILTTRSKE